MKLGAYTACLHDLPLSQALSTLADLGLEGAEINSGGFLPPVHLPVDDLRASEQARADYVGEFEQAGVTLTALNCNGNPLDPNPQVGPRQAQDLLDSIEIAALLGVKRVVTMSGMPGSDASASKPAWNVLPWHSVLLDVRDYQWNDVVVPFWATVQAHAAAHDVKVAIEMHPHNVVYNPATLERLAEAIGATHVGAEMDPATCSGRASSRSRPCVTSAGWSTMPRPRTPGSTPPPGSTVSSTTGSGGSRPTTRGPWAWGATTR